MRLADQKYLLDGNDPKMLIVPCMTLKEANEWRGEGYQAVVLAGLPDLTGSAPPARRRKTPGKGFWKGSNEHECFPRKICGHSTQKVTPAQEMQMLEKARIGLQEAVLGLAHYAKQMASDAKKGLLEGLQESTIETFESIGTSLPKEAQFQRLTRILKSLCCLSSLGPCKKCQRTSILLRIPNFCCRRQLRYGER
ncbi:expressed unknown protein [Seminavis robusta]|uniref:Uncharacterized protein n=1 Tax=Seminavis robusta TaxID=568900 RepID=A0A9N8EG83_9STRA|nr:expressed unknown protein [Seminavis robusta]|eukprot:Sro900_g217780.1 n/a (195) ;mRNA; r:285-869